MDQIYSFASCIRNSQIDPRHASENAHSMTPIVCILDSIPTSQDPDFEKVLDLKAVYFVQGNSHELVSHSLAYVKSCKRVIIFSDKSMENSVESESKSVLTVKLLKKNYPTIPFLVELNDGSYTRLFSNKDYEWNTSNLRMQSILNNYEISSQERPSKYLSVRMECSSEVPIMLQIARFLLGEPSNSKSSPSFQPLLESETDSPTEDKKIFKTKLASRPNTDVSISAQYVSNLLEQAELNESGLSSFPAYHFDKHFSAGMISVSSIMHSLLCQSYFRPFIIDVITRLCSEIVQLVIPSVMIGREYGDLYNYCIDQGYIILGLYRHGSENNSYVYTNPKSHDIISEKDLVFALKENN